MTRDEHLRWAKERALEYVTLNDLPNAVASMISDLGKHEAFRGPAYSFVLPLGMAEIPRGKDAVRRWVEGFN